MNDLSRKLTESFAYLSATPEPSPGSRLVSVKAPSIQPRVPPPPPLLPRVFTGFPARFPYWLQGMTLPHSHQSFPNPKSLSVAIEWVYRRDHIFYNSIDILRTSISSSSPSRFLPCPHQIFPFLVFVSQRIPIYFAI